MVAGEGVFEGGDPKLIHGSFLDHFAHNASSYMPMLFVDLWINSMCCFVLACYTRSLSTLSLEAELVNPLFLPHAFHVSNFYNNALVCAM